MMYHFILGLRGFSATAAAVSDCGAPASVVVSFLVSSCIIIPNLVFRQILDEIGHAAAEGVVHHPEIKRKNKDRNDHNRRGRLHLFTRGRCDLAHLGAHVIVKSLNALGPGLDASCKTRIVRGCNRICHLLCSYRHPSTCLPSETPASKLPASKTLAGAEEFEPPSPVLETGSLNVELTHLYPL